MNSNCSVASLHSPVEISAMCKSLKARFPATKFTIEEPHGTLEISVDSNVPPENIGIIKEFAAGFHDGWHERSK